MALKTKRPAAKPQLKPQQTGTVAVDRAIAQTAESIARLEKRSQLTAAEVLAVQELLS